MQKNNYYVYEHIRLDNNTCFYVGKGSGRRIRIEKRNPHHDNIAKKYGFKTKIIYDNLSEEEALKLEEETIKRYVFGLGYNIDIKGYTNKTSKFCLTNRSWGGEGPNGHSVSVKAKSVLRKKAKEQWAKMTEEEKINYSNKMRQVYYNKSEYERKKLYENRPYAKGKNNPMARPIVGYCLGYEEFFDCIEDAVKKYGLQPAGIRQCCYKKIYHSGFFNNELPLVWNYKEDYINMTSEERKNRIKESMKSTLYCITTNKIFATLSLAKEKYNLNKYVKITDCCKHKSKYAGSYNGQKLEWCYYLEQLNI